MIVRLTLAVLGLALFLSSAHASSPATPSAKDLAARLAARQEGTAYVRLRLGVRHPGETTKTILQLQIKERRTKTTNDLVYQVLWPKERKGEGVLLHKAEGRPASGSLFTPPSTLRSLNASQMKDPLFNSDLSYLDVIEDFFTWGNQAIVGNEAVRGVSCIILESKPRDVESSYYGKVRSWIDPDRLIPLRIEKYLASGQLARRIEATRVATDDKGQPIPADLLVRGPRGSETELAGSKITHGVVFSDRTFTPEGLKDISAPTSSPQ